MSGAHRAHFVVCGAGITGLAVARSLVAHGADDVLVLDKEDGPGCHASGRNSGVLHAGIYYAPGSLRARACLEGNRLMRAWCRERGLPLLEPGKVIVAREEAELPALEALLHRATENGAEPRMLDTRELAEVEPHAKTVERALFSPFTSQVDPRAVLARLRDDLAATGRVRFLFSARVTGLKGGRAGRVAETTAGSVEFRHFVNAAGAHADRVAALFGEGREFVLVPFKGLYKKLRPGREALCRGSIYPVPDPRNPFLGVHFTRSVHGDVYLGPTAIPAFGRENYGLLRGVDAEAPAILARDARLFFSNPGFRRVALTEPRKYFFRAFFNDAKKLVQGLEERDVLPSPKAGIRPQLVHRETGELVMDFVLRGGEDHTHVLNAISPAFTSAFSFAEIVTGKILDSAGQSG
jgi:L-2-hydroxyglutarate oxidase LhgO